MRESMEFLRFLILCGFLFSSRRMATTAPNTITLDQSIRDGEKLVSAGGVFELGFFSPGTSRSRYLGIWYKRVAPLAVVWVANRETPISDSSGVLSIDARGILVLLNSTNAVVWSSNASRTPQNPVTELLISGNLVVKDGNDNSPDNYLWQSFDYPGDTLLPDMKLGKNLVTGQEWFISSWKSANDPSKGDFTMGIDPRGYPQLMIKKGPVIVIRPGPWNGFHWSGAPTVRSSSGSSFNLVSNEKEVIYSYSVHDSSILVRVVMNQSGVAQRFTWTDQTRTWTAHYAKTADECDKYAHCGVNAICNINNFPTCQCLKGFVPNSPGQWNVYNWSAGCVRNASLDCERGDGFLQLREVKLPDTSHSRAVKYISLVECEKSCLKDCSCTAYATLDLRDGGSGCLLWFTDLIDIKNTQGGQDLFVRSVASELDKADIRRQGNGTNHMIIIVTTIITGISGVASLVLIWFLCKRRINLKNEGNTDVGNEMDDSGDESGQGDMGITIYDLEIITNATDNFADENKLGEGGFGPVYKGTLIEGQEIAIKRLSKCSSQGMKEFKNEVILIAKLQHRNLVKLLGCCVGRDERMLIYEYMPNKSLDCLIFGSTFFNLLFNYSHTNTVINFVVTIEHLDIKLRTNLKNVADKTKRKLLDWSKCIQIIRGIVRGLLYLHQDSRLRIIHRDLKASNILLDNEMNPKISDFGMARAFGGDQIEAETKRIVGTYGYMSPEYAIDGIFSTKSDVFSFGVLVLEIMSGKRNKGFWHINHNHNLLGHAWKLWNEEGIEELIDKSLDYSSSLSEILRCIHIGLLCVQQRPEDRPSMSTVVLMLDGEGSLPEPKQPGFFTERNLPELESSSSKHQSTSTNEITISMLEPR